MVQKYNCKHYPVEMTESSNGYWVKFEDYNLLQMECNKKLERLWKIEKETEEKVKLIFEDKLEKQQKTIIYLSVAVFVLVTIELFGILT